MIFVLFTLIIESVGASFTLFTWGQCLTPLSLIPAQSLTSIFFPLHTPFLGNSAHRLLITHIYSDYSKLFICIPDPVTELQPLN